MFPTTSGRSPPFDAAAEAANASQSVGLVELVATVEPPCVTVVAPPWPIVLVTVVPKEEYERAVADNTMAATMMAIASRVKFRVGTALNLIASQEGFSSYSD